MEDVHSDKILFIGDDLTSAMIVDVHSRGESLSLTYLGMFVLARLR